VRLTEEQETFLKYMVEDLRKRYGDKWIEVLETGYPVPDSFRKKFKLHLDIKFDGADRIFQELKRKEILQVEEKTQELDRGSYRIEYPEEKGSPREIEFRGALKGKEERKYIHIQENVMSEIQKEIL